MEILILGILFAFGFSAWFITTSSRNAKKKILSDLESRGIVVDEITHLFEGFVGISHESKLLIASLEDIVYEVPFHEIISYEVINTFLKKADDRHEISLRIVIKDLKNPNLKLTFLSYLKGSILEREAAEKACNRWADIVRIIIETEKK